MKIFVVIFVRDFSECDEYSIIECVTQDDDLTQNIITKIHNGEIRDGFGNKYDSSCDAVILQVWEKGIKIEQYLISPNDVVTENFEWYG